MTIEDNHTMRFQLRLLQQITQMKDCEFCEDMLKSKNANLVTLIIYNLAKMSNLVELCKILDCDE